MLYSDEGAFVRSQSRWLSGCKRVRVAFNINMLRTPVEAVPANRLTFNGLQNMPFCTAIPALLASN